MSTDLELLARAHALFDGHPAPEPLDVAAGYAPASPPSAGAGADRYRVAALAARAALMEARASDAHLAAILAAVSRDHEQARRDTGAVLAAARRDSGADSTAALNPIAAREAMRRRHLRLRIQRAHVLAARRWARNRRRRLRALRYPVTTGRRVGTSTSHSRAAAAVRAALSRIGRPYVWGATGPDQFDCSGLVKWSYAQAGVPLHRTTYDQINDGVPVARSDVRPGDLVFPHAGHVQLAIGNNLVVEAPYAGANVRISPLGNSIAIRRPYP